MYIYRRLGQLATDQEAAHAEFRRIPGCEKLSGQACKKLVLIILLLGGLYSTTRKLYFYRPNSITDADGTVVAQGFAYLGFDTVSNNEAVILGTASRAPQMP